MTGLCNALRSDVPHDAASVVSALTDAARAHAANYRRDDVTVLAVKRELPRPTSEETSHAAVAEPAGQLAAPADGS